MDSADRPMRSSRRTPARRFGLADPTPRQTAGGRRLILLSSRRFNPPAQYKFAENSVQCSLRFTSWLHRSAHAAAGKKAVEANAAAHNLPLLSRSLSSIG